MLKPFFCYFGGKWRAAPHYPAPKHAEIVEPFAGAAGYATRYADRRVTLCDRDPVLAGLWRYLIRVPAAEIRSLPLITSWDQTVDTLGLACQEQKWLIGFWLNGGAAQPCKRPSKWMRDGTRPKSKWGPEIRERLAVQVERIRHWCVVEASYAEIPNRTATWFVDPPYQKAGKYYRYSSSGVDFKELGAWCRERRGQVIACENEGADWLPFRAFRTIKGASGARRSGKSVEVIWTRDDAVRVLDPDDPMLQ